MSARWDVSRVIAKRNSLTPDKAALIFEDKPVTYNQIWQGSNRFARFLMEKGMKKGDRLCIVALNCPEFLEAYFGAAKLGLVFVPLNWRLEGPELEYQINDCGAKMLLFQDAFTPNIEKIKNSICVDADKFVFMDGPMPGLVPVPDWVSEYKNVVNTLSGDYLDAPEPVTLDDPLAIVYTSGVTGNPKGAVLSHGQTYFKIFQIALYTGGNPDDVVLAQLPLFHSGGLFIVATPALMGGATIVMRAGFDPNLFAEDIEKYKANVVFALTTMWRFILDSGKLDTVKVSSVHTVVGGGERTPPSLFTDLGKRGLFLQQGFGQTECSAMTVMPKPDIQRKLGSVGKPGAFVDIWIEDERGNKLPPNTIGEIMAQGPTVMSEYWNLPEKTKEALNNGVLKTGDLGYLDDEGFLYIVDRSKDMYRSGAENVYPAEVEKVIASHPKIANAAIIGIPDDKWGETGMAFILPMMGQTVTEEEVRAHLEGKVAKFKRPKYIVFVSELPYTATMKIRKAALKKEYKNYLK
ncbi:MAG: AMP-binding protein [Desulfatibacillaceae bacterium]|nr:AMP-binding protein [Desulfatibacillaceae bacterium]